MNREQRRAAEKKANNIQKVSKVQAGGHPCIEFKKGWFDVRYPEHAEFQHIVIHEGIPMTMTEKQFQGFLAMMDLMNMVCEKPKTA